MSRTDPSSLSPFLAKLTRHSRLGEAAQQAILALPALPAQVRPNQDFVRLGERVEHACLVVDGLVGRFGQNREGGRQIMALYLPADMPDLHSVVVPQASSALQALSVTTILRVPHSALRAVARNHPAAAEAFWRECVLDSAILAEWIVNVGRRDARSRIAHVLCEMAFRHGEAGGGGPAAEFDFPATQVHLADMTGLTPVHVHRTLQGLRTEGLIELRHRIVRILDWDELVRVGDFDPAYLEVDGAVQNYGVRVA